MIVSAIVAAGMAMSVPPVKEPRDTEETPLPDINAVLVGGIELEDTDDSEEKFLSLV